MALTEQPKDRLSDDVKTGYHYHADIINQGLDLPLKVLLHTTHKAVLGLQLSHIAYAKHISKTG